MKRIVAIGSLFVLLLLICRSDAGFAVFQTNGFVPSLPSGVTLKAIDGETLTSSTTMSNNYYSRSGYSAAHTMGWDNPNFFPLGPFESDYNTSIVSSAVTQMTALSWNTLFDWGNAPTAGLIATNNISTVGSYQNGHTSQTNMVGVLTYDEPVSSGTPYASGISTPLSTLVNATQDTRFWWINNTIAWAIGTTPALTGDPAPHTPTSDLAQLITTPNSTTRHIDLQSIDVYWFAGARDPNFSTFNAVNGKNYYGLGSNMTSDQSERGSNYGDIIDTLRGYQSGGTPAPLGIYLETGDPFWNTSSGTPSTSADVILPPEFNWAVWAMIVHGARAIYMFDHFGPTTGTGTTDDNLTDTRNTFYTTIQSGQSVSMSTQAASTCGLVALLAPIINAPSALGYTTVSPAGYLFPTPHKVLPAAGSPQVDVTTKWYQGGSFSNTAGGGPTTFTNGFYIFATTRASETDTNISATFTINDPNATSVDVVGESRSISISAGTFTDSFANAWSVHIYRVNG